MRRLDTLAMILLVMPLFLSGCLAIAAGGIAGNEASRDESIEYYITTEQPSDRIAKAMKDRRIVAGMNKTEVRLTMKDNEPWPDKPNQVKALPDTNIVRWTYKRPHDPMRVDDRTATIVFRDGEVMRASPALTERWSAQ